MSVGRRIAIIGLAKEQDVTRIQNDPRIADQIRAGEGPIELIDSNGKMIGVVRRPPTDDEVARAKEHSSRGRQTLTRAQLMAKVSAETSQ